MINILYSHLQRHMAVWFFPLSHAVSGLAGNTHAITQPHCSHVYVAQHLDWSRIIQIRHFFLSAAVELVQIIYQNITQWLTALDITHLAVWNYFYCIVLAFFLSREVNKAKKYHVTEEPWTKQKLFWWCWQSYLQLYLWLLLLWISPYQQLHTIIFYASFPPYKKL